MIQVSHLTKYYGDFLAVNDLSFDIEDGHVYGFLGPNGAGKSTTMNIMTGCLSPTAGSIKIGGYDILEEPEKAKSLMGYLPEQPPLYLNETPEEYLTFVGEAKGLKRRELKSEIDRVIESTGLQDVRSRIIGTLSKGYKQRVGIAQAIMGHPKVIILDEPTVGLDPIQIIEIREFIKELGREHTVILSSHILSEVQAVCEKVLIISKGRLVAFDAPENLEKLLVGTGSITFSVEASKEKAEEILAETEGLDSWEVKESGSGLSVSAELSEGADTKTVCGKLTLAFAAKGLPVFEMKTRKANLEDVFLELTEEGTAESQTVSEEDKRKMEELVEQELGGGNAVDPEDETEETDEEDTYDAQSLNVVSGEASCGEADGHNMREAAAFKETSEDGKEAAEDAGSAAPDSADGRKTVSDEAEVKDKEVSES